MRINIIDKDLMKERLSQKMIEKGFVHQNGKPFQLELATAINEKKSQSTISSLLRAGQNTIEDSLLTKLAKALNVQERWLLGGEFVPLQEKPLLNEEIYSPEAKSSEKGNSDILRALQGIEEALFMIMRQMQKLNSKEERNG